MINAIVLAVVQGLTEFLPVSSSGHLVLGEALLGANSIGQSIAFELVVHLGTFLAVLVIFWNDILHLIGVFIPRIARPALWKQEYAENPDFKLAILMLVAMLPAGVIGLLLRDHITDLFSQPFMVSIALLLTGSMLLSTKFYKKSDNSIGLLQSILIGFAQALALVPGISRSGSTISMGLALGIKQKDVARFSFIMVLPLIIAATALEFIDLLKVGISLNEILHLFVGLVVSFVVGYLSLKWLLNLLKQGHFHYFAWYCYAIAIAGLFYF